ncbi:MAG: molybdate ABC transporter substrate-binding protein [Thermodesulfovibrionales bacterium]|nr:molybdate ABC transporter substrate-binding protein [Thermodesulfovibrionales bacterium]
MLVGVPESKAEEIMVFAGSASRPPTEEAAKIFEKKTGIKVNLIFGGSGFLLSQMILNKKGDIYFPGSSDYMEIARKKDVIFPGSERPVVYLVPAINVRKGNPKNIRSLKDLTKPGLKIALSNPEGVCLGAYAIEIIEKNFTHEEKNQFRKNLINYTESCEKTATVISLGAADAVIGWSVFEDWDPERIETVPLKRSEILRIGYIPIAISKFTKNRSAAEKFINFLLSNEGKAVFRKYNYFITAHEAFSWIGEKKPIGGQYIIPDEWLKK